MTLEEKIAQISIKLHQEELDASLSKTLKRNLMDSYAGICGSMYDKDMLKNFDRLVSGIGSGSDLEVWGINKKGTLADAIFVNAIMARRSDLLNTFISPNGMGGVHPSDNVALCLILADWLNMNGSEFLKLIRSMFYLATSFATYYDPESAGYDHDAAASFITALGIGLALNCSEHQLVSAQRIVGMLGLDINEAAVGQMTDWKHCTYASCAYRAFMAIKLAMADFQAPPEIYEGPLGVNHFLPHADAFPDKRPDLTKIIFKRWPALVFCQTPIDVALAVAGKIQDKDSIDSITVKTFDVAYRNGAIESAMHPTTRAGRTHSIAYCVATALLKPIEYSDFDEERSKDTKLNDLMSKIQVINDNDLSKQYPQKSPCTISVKLKSGETVEEHRDYPKGDPADPLSDQEIEDKLKNYFFFAKDESEQSSVIEKLWDIDKQPDINWLLNPLKQKLI